MMGVRLLSDIRGLEGLIGRVSPLASPSLFSAFQLDRRGMTDSFTDLHKQIPPYRPELASDDDTRYFDQDIPDEVSSFPCLL